MARKEARTKLYLVKQRRHQPSILGEDRWDRLELGRWWWHLDQLCDRRSCQIQVWSCGLIHGTKQLDKLIDGSSRRLAVWGMWLYILIYPIQTDITLTWATLLFFQFAVYFSTVTNGNCVFSVISISVTRKLILNISPNVLGPCVLNTELHYFTLNNFNQ